MRVVTADIMRELDRRTIEEIGIPGVVLMENAGRGATRILLDRFQDLHKGPVVVVCGAGNNGGDGFVMARCLRENNLLAKVFLLVPPDRISGDARINFDVLTRLDIPWQELSSIGIRREVGQEWKRASCIVDAIFGTGLSREVEGIYREAIEAVNRAARPVLAVDIPSGVNADTGKVHGVAVHSRYTATFGLPKRGLFLHPGAACAGKVEAVEIGIPGNLVAELGGQEEVLDAAPQWQNLWREPDTHKGTYGHLFVLSGSTGKTGAAHLCSEAALRSGAGLVTLGIPEQLNPVMEEKLTEVMTLPLPSTREGVLSKKAVDGIKMVAASLDGVAIGPGLGITEEVEGIIREVWLTVDKPMVWDADALTLLSRNPDLRGKQRASIILTPHPGEMSRMLDKPVSWVQENRVEAAKALSEQWGVVTVLKGARSLIADSEGRLSINLTGNAGMAAGGMGDVLTGIIGALLVQGLDGHDAASLGVWLHGAAGDRAALTLGPFGFLASEVMNILPALFREIMEEGQNG